MFEERTDTTRLDLKVILERSVIKGEGISRILMAPRCHMKGGIIDKEAAFLCIARLSDWWTLIAGAPHLRPTEDDWKAADRFSKAFVTMLDAIPGAARVDRTLPLPPIDWVSAAEGWITAQAKSEKERRTKRRARPTREDKRFVFPMLLEVYVCAYGRRPSATAGGPTYRFVRAFIDELNAALQHMKTDPPEVLRTWRKATRVTSEATLLSDIRAAAKHQAQRDVGKHLFREMQRLAVARPRGTPSLSP